MWHLKTAQLDSSFTPVSCVFFAGLQSGGSTAVVIGRFAPNSFDIMD